MFHFDQWLGLENTFEGSVLALFSLLIIALLIAVLQEHWTNFWTSNPETNGKLFDSFEKSSDETVNEIVSPTTHYEIIEKTGFGDLCDVFKARTDKSNALLKITRVAGGKELMTKEFSLLEHLHQQSSGQVYQEFFPKPLETFSQNETHINAYEWREGLFTAEQILDRQHQGLDGRHLGWMFNRVLEALGFVHQQGWIHGAVLPPHLLFQAEEHGLQLAGWIHAEKTNTILKVVPERFKAWYPPECQNKHPASASVDIYLAAKSLIYLAGGDPITNQMPEHIPVKMHRFVKGCLLESPRMRSNDAWEVRREFGELLEGLYGPPAFHPLDMS